jgi:importin subunit alpha-6/7
VAGDGPKLRDIVLSYNTIAPLIQNLQNPATISLFRNCTWTLSNMCRGKPQPPLSILAPALPVLANILFQNKDIETMVDATWALSYISDGENARIQAVVDTGVVPYLTNILRSDNVQAVVPSLRTLGNIVSGDDHQTQCVLDANVLTALVPLLSHSKKNIRKETCWLLSNIAAGTFEQLTQLVNTPGLLPRVLEQLSGSSEWDVRKEACWVVSNLASVGQTAHIHDQLVEFGVIAPLCELLSTADVKVLMVAMEALESLLKMGGEGKLIRYTQLVDEAGGIDSLERLQEHENPAVYAKAVSIIENYFGGEDEGESENIAPTVVEKNGFSSFAFGLETTKATSSSSFNFGDIRNVENRDISNITNHQSAFQFGN